MPQPRRAVGTDALRVLWLVDSLEGASEDAQIRAFLNAVDPARTRVDVLALDGAPHPELERALRERGVSVARLGAKGPARLFPFIRLVRRLRGKGYDLVHAHLPWAALWGAAAARLAGVPIVATLYGRAPDETGRSAGVERDRLAHRALRRWARRVFAISGAQWDRYVREGVFSRTMLEVIYQGVDVEAVPARAAGDGAWLREQAGFPGTSPVAVSTARLDDVDSGVDVLFWAIPAILEAVPQARFVIAGEGALKRELQRRVRARGLNQVVHWAGEGDDVPRILAGADLFIHPTLRDPFPTEVLEAMAAGLPVVGTRVGGVPEIIGSSEVGRLVPRSNPEALAAAVVELFQDPARLPAMQEAARARVEAHFSSRGWVDRTEEVYRAVVAEVRAGKPRRAGTYARLSVELRGLTA